MSSITMQEEKVTEEVECQTNIQCTPHILHVGELAKVQCEATTQTEVSLEPTRSDTNILPKLMSLPSNELLRDVMKIIMLRTSSQTRKNHLQWKSPSVELSADSFHTTVEEPKDTDHVEQGEAPEQKTPEVENPPEEDDDESEELKGILKTYDSDEKVDPVITEDSCQTNLHVFPHYLTEDEIAVVSSDSGVQTYVTCYPNASVSELIPKLKTYFEHEGLEPPSAGDSHQTSMLELITELLNEVDEQHLRMFDADLSIPRIPLKTPRVMRDANLKDPGPIASSIMEEILDDLESAANTKNTQTGAVCECFKLCDLGVGDGKKDENICVCPFPEEKDSKCSCRGPDEDLESKEVFLIAPEHLPDCPCATDTCKDCTCDEYTFRPLIHKPDCPCSTNPCKKCTCNAYTFRGFGEDKGDDEFKSLMECLCEYPELKDDKCDCSIPGENQLACTCPNPELIDDSCECHKPAPCLCAIDHSVICTCEKKVEEEKVDVPIITEKEIKGMLDSLGFDLCSLCKLKLIQKKKVSKSESKSSSPGESVFSDWDDDDPVYEDRISNKSNKDIRVKIVMNFNPGHLRPELENVIRSQTCNCSTSGNVDAYDLQVNFILNSPSGGISPRTSLANDHRRKSFPCGSGEIDVLKCVADIIYGDIIQRVVDNADTIKKDDVCAKVEELFDEACSGDLCSANDGYILNEILDNMPIDNVEIVKAEEETCSPVEEKRRSTCGDIIKKVQIVDPADSNNQNTNRKSVDCSVKYQKGCESHIPGLGSNTNKNNNLIPSDLEKVEEEPVKECAANKDLKLKMAAQKDVYNISSKNEVKIEIKPMAPQSTGPKAFAIPVKLVVTMPGKDTGTIVPRIIAVQTGGVQKDIPKNSDTQEGIIPCESPCSAPCTSPPCTNPPCNAPPPPPCIPATDPLPLIYEDDHSYDEQYVSELFDIFKKKAGKCLLDIDDDDNEDDFVYKYGVQYAEPYAVSGYASKPKNVEIQTVLALGRHILSTSLSSMTDEETDYDTCDEGFASNRSKKAPVESIKSNLPWRNVILPPPGSVKFTPIERPKTHEEPVVAFNVLPPQPIKSAVKGAGMLQPEPQVLTKKLSLLYNQTHVYGNEPYTDAWYRQMIECDRRVSPCSSETEVPWDTICLPTDIDFRTIIRVPPEKPPAEIPICPVPCLIPCAPTCPPCLPLTATSVYTLPKKSPKDTMLKFDASRKVIQPSASQPTISMFSAMSSRIINIMPSRVNSYMSTKFQVMPEISSALMSVVTFDGPHSKKGQVKKTRSAEGRALRGKISFKGITEQQSILTSEDNNNQMKVIISNEQKFIISAPADTGSDNKKTEKSDSPDSAIICGPCEPREEDKIGKEQCKTLKGAPCEPCNRDFVLPTSSSFTKQDPVVLAMIACEAELKPIKQALNQVQQKLRTLNMPELDCILKKEPLDIPPRTPNASRQAQRNVSSFKIGPGRNKVSSTVKFENPYSSQKSQQYIPATPPPFSANNYPGSPPPPFSTNNYSVAPSPLQYQSHYGSSQMNPNNSRFVERLRPPFQETFSFPIQQHSQRYGPSDQSNQTTFVEYLQPPFQEQFSFPIQQQSNQLYVTNSNATSFGGSRFPSQPVYDDSNQFGSPPGMYVDEPSNRSMDNMSSAAVRSRQTFKKSSADRSKVTINDIASTNPRYLYSDESSMITPSSGVSGSSMRTRQHFKSSMGDDRLRSGTGTIRSKVGLCKDAAASRSPIPSMSYPRNVYQDSQVKSIPSSSASYSPTRMRSRLSFKRNPVGGGAYPGVPSPYNNSPGHETGVINSKVSLRRNDFGTSMASSPPPTEYFYADEPLQASNNLRSKVNFNESYARNNSTKDKTRVSSFQCTDECIALLAEDQDLSAYGYCPTDSYSAEKTYMSPTLLSSSSKESLPQRNRSKVRSKGQKKSRGRSSSSRSSQISFESGADQCPFLTALTSVMMSQKKKKGSRSLSVNRHISKKELQNMHVHLRIRPSSRTTSSRKDSSRMSSRSSYRKHCID